MAAEEVHHEILCAVIQEKWLDWQALSEATLHNVPLRIICLSTLNAFVPEPEGYFADITGCLQCV